MAKSKTTAAKLDISFQRGTTFYRQIIVTGVPIPVGTTFHLHILSDINSVTVLQEFTSVTVESLLGTSFTIELAAAATLAGSLPNEVYFYKVEAIIPDTLAVVRMLEGSLVLKP